MALFHCVADQWNVSKLLELEAKNNENENKNHKFTEMLRA